MQTSGVASLLSAAADSEQSSVEVVVDIDLKQADGGCRGTTRSPRQSAWCVPLDDLAV